MLLRVLLSVVALMARHIALKPMTRIHSSTGCRNYNIRGTNTAVTGYSHGSIWSSGQFR